MNVNQQTILLLKDHSPKYDEAFSQYKLNTISIPVLAEEYINMEKLEEFIIQFNFLEQYWGFIITSPRASKAFETILENLSIKNAHSELLQHLKKLPIFVPGEGTSGNLEKVGYSNIIGKESGNADNLFIDIKDHYTKNNTSKKLLFLVGDKTRPTLPNKMNEFSISFDKFQVYQTYKDGDFDSSISKLNLAEINWVAFFSPSGIDFSYDILQSWLVENHVKIAAIGETTKLHLEELNFIVSACPLKPNANDLAHAIATENLIR